MPDFDSIRKGRGRGIAWAVGVLLLALFVYILPDSYKAPIRDSLRGTVLRPFLALQARLAARGRIGNASTLKAQRDSLLALVAAQSALAEENGRLRAALGLGERLGATFVPAQVLRVGANGAASSFLIDAGSDNGVAIGSPVLSPDGLVGVVWAVDASHAQVLDWTHPEFRASAMTADGSTYGIIEAKRGAFREEDLMVLTGAPFHTDIRIGRRIVTSGRGALFPRGVPIGTVAGIDDADTGWRKSYLIRPAARPEGLVHVLVGVRAGGDVTSVFAPPVPPDSAAPRLTPAEQAVDSVIAPPPPPPPPPPPDTASVAARAP